MEIEFLKANELNEVMQNIFQSEIAGNRCVVGYSEQLDTDTIAVYSADNELVKEVTVNEMYKEIGNELKATITSHDVMEVGDYGEGFVFFL